MLCHSTWHGGLVGARAQLSHNENNACKGISLRSLLGHSQSIACRDISRSLRRIGQYDLLPRPGVLGATSILSVSACRNARLCKTPDAEQPGTSCKAQHVEGVWSGSHSLSYDAEARTASCRHLHSSRTQPPLCIAAHICQLLKGLGLLWLPDGLLAGNVHRCSLGLWVDLAAQADVHALLSAEGRCSTSPCSDRLLGHLLPLGCIAGPFRNGECSTEACVTWLQVARHCYAQRGVAPSCSAVLGSNLSSLLSSLPVTAVRAT